MTGLLCFYKRTGGCISKYTTIDYEQLATFGFGQKTGLNIRAAVRILIVRPPMPMSADKPLVIYDHRVRWVAAVNMAFVVAGVWLAIRLGAGLSLYLPVGFLGLFGLFWIRDLLCGFRLKLLSGGCTLHWREGKEIGSVPPAQIRKVLIGARRPIQIGDSGVLGWTYVRFQLRTGTEQALPPNIASGLRSRNWRHLKRLISHIRTVSNVTVEPINEPDLSMEGWRDEPDGAANAAAPHRSPLR